MSRRDDYRDRYDDRDRDYRPRPRRDREYEEVDIDIRRERSRGPERRVDPVVLDRRDERRERAPDFLREDYGRVDNRELIVREQERDDDNYSRVSKARSRVSQHPREEIDIKITERERERPRLPYPTSDVGRGERDVVREEIVFRDAPRSRAPSREPPRRAAQEELEINIRRREDDDVRSVASPRSEVRRDDRPPPAIRIEREEIDIRDRDRRHSPPRSSVGRRDEREEIDIRIRESDAREERSRPHDREERDEIDIRYRESERPRREPDRPRGVLVGRKEEVWEVRRPRREPSPPPREEITTTDITIRQKERSPSPEPSPPPRREVDELEIDIRRTERERSADSPLRSEVKEERITIRQKERSPSPEPPPAPYIKPIVRPPIVQEVITHYRNIDHGFERARPRSPSPTPSPPRKEEEDLEIAIRRSGTRNGRAYNEEVIIEHDHKEDSRSIAPPSRRRSPSRSYDDIAREAEYYQRRAQSRSYQGEAYNGVTKKWELVDVPPGTERVRMDGIGGGGQEITWQRYNGERTSKFYAGDRVYEQDLGRSALPPSSRSGRSDDRVEETRIDIRREEGRKDETEIDIDIRKTTRDDKPAKQKVKERMWTEVTKDLVIKEAIEESGYDYEETDQFYYVMEYLRYEDVVRLVELTEEIRRERKERIREIQREREELERAAPKMIEPPPPPASHYDERIYEREVIYDREGRRYR